MKKVFLWSAAVAMVLTGCDNADEMAWRAGSATDGVTFSLPQFEWEEGQTRVDVAVGSSVSFTWAEGDTLGVFPQNGYPTAFPISSGAGTETALFDGADWALRPSAQYAAYYPYSYANATRTQMPVSYLGQTQTGNASTAHLGAYSYMTSAYTGVDASGNANFQMQHLGCLLRLVLTMPGADTYSRAVLKSTGTFLTEGTYAVGDDAPSLTATASADSLVLALDGVSTTSDDPVLTLYMMLPPADHSSQTWTIDVLGADQAYSATLTSANMVAGKAYSRTASPAAASVAEENGHAYVDLGLSSGTLWATCNLGAEHPYDYGNYYAWGETKGYGEEDESNAHNYSYTNGSYTKTYYYWSAYKYATGTSWTTISKYTYPDDQTDGCWYDSDGNFIGDSLTQLLPADDAAYANWGGSWRMPTDAEITELRESCYWEWTTDYDGQGVSGYIVYKAKADADKGLYSYNSPTLSTTYDYTEDVHVFLPAAGYRYGSSLYYAGSYGYYWSSSLITSYSYYACFLFFNSSGVGRSYGYRYYGRSVRPVYNPNDVAVTSVTISKTSTSLEAGSSETLTAEVLPSDAFYNQVTWSSSDPTVATVVRGVVTAVTAGTATITATACDGSGLSASCVVTVVASHAYVDLGLSSGTLWATCNLGAEHPYDYGNYYAWGETKGYGEEDETNAHNYSYTNGSYTKTYYYWDAYKYATGTSWTTISKYTYPDSQTGCWYDSDGNFIGDSLTQLLPADDAAYVNWGGSWRMPTDAEITELHASCYWEWTTDYDGQGVSGYIVYKAKADADKGLYDEEPLYDYDYTEDVHVFLPAAGSRYGSSLGNAGSYGYYWSSSLDAGYSGFAYSLYFISSYVGRSGNSRYYGRSVRPVRSSSE